jgi:hypothetical protein
MKKTNKTVIFEAENDDIINIIQNNQISNKNQNKNDQTILINFNYWLKK